MYINSVLEGVETRCFNDACRQAVPSVYHSLCEEVLPKRSVASVFLEFVDMTSGGFVFLINKQFFTKLVDFMGVFVHLY